MKRKISNNSTSKEKVLKIIASNGVSTRNRNVQTTFRKYARPELRRTITNVEDSNWLAQHGNDYELFTKEKSKRKSYKKLVIILGLIGFFFILAISTGLGLFFYYFFTFTTTSVYLIPLNGTNTTTNTAR